MCGRFACSLPPDELRRLLRTVSDVANHPASWNIAPTQSALVVRRHPDSGERRLDTLSWGLIPSFVRDAPAERRPVNARAETIARSGMFRGAFASRRCLVPMDAFYEWEATPTGKQPWAFARTDRAPLVLAALWEGARAPDGTVRRTFAIATVPANRFMGRIHDRMPAILEPQDWATWLGEQAGDPASLLRPAGEAVLRTWPVSRDVNAPRHDRPDLLHEIVLPDRPRDEKAAGPDPA